VVEVFRDLSLAADLAAVESWVRGELAQGAPEKDMKLSVTCAFTRSTWLWSWHVTEA
jgi:hypothetical protein